MEKRCVLAVGSGSSRLAASVPALLRQGFEIDRVSSAQTALELARHVPFHLALLDYPPTGIGVADLAEALVAAGLPEHRTRVVLIAPPDRIREARAHVGKAIDAVLSVDATPEESAHVLHELLGAAPRLSVRISVRVEVILEGESSLVFRQTEDLSTAGMLVRAPRALPVGTEVSFRLDPPGARSPIEGRAQVVRHVLDADAQAVLATGLRFVSFRGDGDVRLRSFLESSVRPNA